MNYPECKVYVDASGNYIAIPHTEGRKGKRIPAPEQLVELQTPIPETTESATTKQTDAEKKTDIPAPSPKPVYTTRKAIFEGLYKAHINEKYKDRKKSIIEGMKPYFSTEQDCISYVQQNLRRKYRNYMYKKLRMSRKAFLQAEWTHFATFTYDDKKQTAESFVKGIKTVLRNNCHRKGWKYIGVFERGAASERVHFHALMYIPDGTMPGEIKEVKDRDVRHNRMQITHQNTYFSEKFGRNDFSPINKYLIEHSINYILKYIEKSGAKIVYSRNLPQFFISDIMGEDIICDYDLDKPEEERGNKKLLFNDFKCFDEGVYMGNASPETIAKMRKSN